jgi:SAM-dependent methyltransferase
MRYKMGCVTCNQNKQDNGDSIVISAQTKQELEKRLYPDLKRRVFGEFEAAFVARLDQHAVALDAGSGPGSWILQAQRHRLHLLVGEDVYLPDTSNLDAFVLATSERLPFADGAFDVVVAYLMLEHLPTPLLAFREFARVLKPGGYFCFKTPAVRTPLFLLAHLMPTSWHRRLKSRIGVAEHDVFPTFYRANTVRILDRDLAQAGLVRDWLRTVDQTYAYLSHSRGTYALGLLYSRSTELPALAWLRNQIIGIYRRPPRSYDGR